ncbi:unnamed protein product [Ilex paraguariensis]|uniref:RRM domain-containing protein n=1 Tax=Ilex paraguariensis TaxID=185542 RepID=A0ABC8R2T8_9AQUA
MAFCNRFGSLMRQTISQSSASNGQVPMASMFNAIRCMSSSKLFIGGLSYGVDDQSLKDAFSSFGDVTEARVIIDRDSGRSRGFGFVNLSSDESASSAMSAMDGQVRELNWLANICIPEREFFDVGSLLFSHWMGGSSVSFATDRAGPPRAGGPIYRGGFGNAGRNDGY